MGRMRGNRRRKTSFASFIRLLLVLQNFSHALNDLSIYGSFFDMNDGSAVNPRDVIDVGCFGGLRLGTCKPKDYIGYEQGKLDAYNDIYASGMYCLSCCSNSFPSSGEDTWDLACQIITTTQRKFINLFGYSFVFLRNQFDGDTELVECSIPRTACSYDSSGTLTTACTADSSYLTGYTLTLNVNIVSEPLIGSRREIKSCSVEVEETTSAPKYAYESIVMKHDYDNYDMHWLWAIFIALACAAGASYGARWARKDYCIVCGHRLIWFCNVCVMCRFYGYKMPSQGAQAAIRQKREQALREGAGPTMLRTIECIAVDVGDTLKKGFDHTKDFSSSIKKRLKESKTAPSPFEMTSIMEDGVSPKDSDRVNAALHTFSVGTEALTPPASICSETKGVTFADDVAVVPVQSASERQSERATNSSRQARPSVRLKPK